MIENLMMDLKGRLTSHLETRDIRIMLSSQLERTDKTLGVMEKYNKFLSNPTSPHSQALYSMISREAGIRDKDLYKHIKSGMKDTYNRLDALVDLYENNNHRVLISSNLTTINANALHLAAICDFYERMGRAMVLCVSELESLKYRSMGMPKELANYMKTNFSRARVLSMGSIVSYNVRMKKKDVVKVIREMDDIEVTEEVLQAARAMGGTQRVDPAGFNYLNILNPTFWAYTGIKAYSELRLMYLDLQKDELQMLEIRHQELVQLKANGETDMATDKMITNLKDKIDIKRYDIKELEESMG